MLAWLAPVSNQGKIEFMVHEMRVYQCTPGKLPALLVRFRDITLPIFDRFGIRTIGFWTTLVGSSNQTLTYMIAWNNLAEREQKWDAFMNDPDWLAKKAETEKDGVPYVINDASELFTPTAFSLAQ